MDANQLPISESPARRMPRGLYWLAILSVVATTVLLVLGSLVTSFRVGMSDPIWPTEPWYLSTIDWKEHHRGFLIEHTHRLAGFTVGALISLLTLGIWWCIPHRRLRWVGLISVFVLLAIFGNFHRVMMKQVEEPRVVWPMGMIATMGLALVLALGSGLLAAFQKSNRTPLGLLSVVVLAAVMVQGLLGGLRVRLDALFGTDFALIHGSFASLVFALLLALTWSLRRASRNVAPAPLLPAVDRRKLRWQSVALVLFAFGQIVLGAMLRHYGSPLSQRLHLLNAFIVFGFATLIIKQMLIHPQTKKIFFWPCYLLMFFMTFQVVLGVEAWLGKFVQTNVELSIPREIDAAVRSSHSHLGLWIFGISVITWLMVRQLPAHTKKETYSDLPYHDVAPNPQETVSV
ncbi:MAG: hypothetical protein R3B84_23520 [Zavarzinella sp.]